MQLEVKDVDRQFYHDRLKDFLPERIIDIHTHVWLDEHKSKTDVRGTAWSQKVTKNNSLEDLMATYALLFPGKKITPLLFACALSLSDDFDSQNKYVSQCAEKHAFPALFWALPEYSAAELEEKTLAGNFLGTKSYLTLAPPHIPESEVRISDFFPHHHLEVINRHSWIMALHIPRPGRLKDSVNLAQMLEIEKRYPNIKMIIAHVGRAYCQEDVGNAFEVLSETKNMLFDISANTNTHVFRQLIEAVGPKRILFGSDLPITRMRMRRICENGRYINLVPRGLYGDVSGDPHMREVDAEAAKTMTFFIYEEIEALRGAAEAIGLTDNDIKDIFYHNAQRILSPKIG